jgi:sensor histidine kinase regulating citrate/malate metabolism
MTPEDRLAQALADLGEHFDVLQIFAQVHDSETDQTETWSLGSGNHLARIQQVSTWIDTQDETSELTD